jgi:HK97 family phage major capsid protein
MNEIGNIKSRVNTIPISANSDGLELYAVDETSRATGSRWGGVQVYWGAEADEATAKKPKVRRMLLELKDLIGLAYASNRLLRDASALGAIFTQAFSEEMNFMIEDGLINGNGVGKPIGVLNSGAVVSVAKETGQAAATIVYENIVKMYSRCWLRSRPNAVWIYNQDIEPQLMTMSIGVGTAGQPVYLPAGGASASPYATLMGRPAFPVEYCATLGTTGDIMLIDFSQMAAIEKDAMQADQSIHVRFNTNENTFRFIYRFDAQPTWNSALTPYKGSATKSFAIKLDTRA